MDVTMNDSRVEPSKYGQVQVYFTTNFPDIELPEAKRQLLVPTSKYEKRNKKQKLTNC